MKNLKNLRGLLIAFTLVLITGIAFAVVAQDLTLGGTVSFQQIAVKLEPAGGGTGVSKSGPGTFVAEMAQSTNGYDLDFTVAFTEANQIATFEFKVTNESGFTVRPTNNTTDSLGAFITLANDDTEEDGSPSISISGTYDDATFGLANLGTITSGSSSASVTLIITCVKAFATPITVSLSVKYVQA